MIYLGSHFWNNILLITPYSEAILYYFPKRKKKCNRRGLRLVKFHEYFYREKYNLIIWLRCTNFENEVCKIFTFKESSIRYSSKVWYTSKQWCLFFNVEDFLESQRSLTFRQNIAIWWKKRVHLELNNKYNILLKPTFFCYGT